MYTGDVDGAMEDRVSETVSLSETTLKETVALSETTLQETVALSETTPKETVALSETTPKETLTLSETTLKETVATFQQLAAESEDFKTDVVETKTDNSFTNIREKDSASMEEDFDYTVSNVSINYNIKRESERHKSSLIKPHLKFKPHCKQKNKPKIEFKMKRKSAANTTDTKAMKGNSKIAVESSLEEEDAVQKLLSHMGREADRVSGRLKGRGVTLQNSLRAGLITISVNKEGDTMRDDEKYFETHCAVTKKIPNCTSYRGHCNCGKCKLASNKSISTRLENENHQNISVWPNHLKSSLGARNSIITVVKDPFNSKRSLAVKNLTKDMNTDKKNCKVLKKRKINCRKCPKVFNDHLAWKKHMTIHYKLACTVCGKPFKESNSLNLHMRIHAPDRPFSCDLCGKGFNQKGNLLTHKIKNHNKMSS